MPYSKAKGQATVKYIIEKTDELRVRVPKGELKKLKDFVETTDYNSMSQFVVTAINSLAGCDLLTVPHGIAPEKLKRMKNNV